MAEERFAWIGREKDCGCLTAAVVDGENKQRVAEHIAEFVMEGLVMDRVPVETVRVEMGNCDRCGPASHQSQGVANKEGNDGRE